MMLGENFSDDIHRDFTMQEKPSWEIPGPPCGRTTAARLGYHSLFSNHLSKSVAFQQSSVPKLLVAGLQSLFVMNAKNSV